jgi:repressor LexA
MAEPLTQLEQRVYHYLLDFLNENTYQPSIREIGKRFRIKSTKTVSDLLQSLADKGFIERDPSRSRGVRLLGHATPSRTQPVPVYAKVHAGTPALLTENRERFITVDRNFVPNENIYALKVKGDSMTGRGILNGDFVLVDPAAQAIDGAIVAVRLGEEAAIKTYSRSGDTVLLQAAHPGEPDITVNASEVSVLGSVCGVLRYNCDRGSFPAPVGTA